jgi:hypothetical protein
MKNFIDQKTHWGVVWGVWRDRGAKRKDVITLRSETPARTGNSFTGRGAAVAEGGLVGGLLAHGNVLGKSAKW